MHKRLKQLNIVLIVVLFLGNPLSGLSAGLPRAVSPYDPPPTTTVAPSSSSSAPTTTKTPPVPGDLSPEVEQARVQQAMDAAVDKYLNYWGPRYQLASVEVTVAGDWAYGIAEWKSQERILKEPLNLLAYRSPDGTWQVALPDNDDVFLQWVEAAPEHLVSAPTKDRLLAQVIEAVAVRPPKAIPMVPSPTTVLDVGGPTVPANQQIPIQPTATPTAMPPVMVTVPSPDRFGAPDHPLPTPVQLEVIPTVPFRTVESEIPLYPNLAWSGSRVQSETIDIGTSMASFPGIAYQSEIIYQKPSGDVIDYYSPERLLEYGWRHVNGAIGILVLVDTYFKAPNRYMTVQIAGHNNSELSEKSGFPSADGYFVIVWISSPELDVPVPIISTPQAQASTMIPLSPEYQNPLPVPLFSQNSNIPPNNWKTDRQGWPDSGYPNACDYSTLGGYGCWTTSYSMLYNYYQSNFTNPRDLNNKLNIGLSGGPKYGSCPVNDHCNNCMPGGSPYAPTGVSRGTSHYNSCTQSNCIDPANVTIIDNEINAGRPLLAYVHFLGTSPQHMIVIIGHSGSTYYINDPWNGQQLTLATGALGAYVVDYIYEWGGTPPSGTTCPGPSLQNPPDGYISQNQTIDFSWSAPSGCTFEGYTFRIKTVPTMDSGGTTIVDTGNSQTSRTETISTQWNNQDLYWGVRTANPLSPNWSVRRFRIEPGSPPPPSCNPTADQVAFYLDPNYGGSCVVKNVGQYPHPSDIGLDNDSIASIKVGGNVRAVVCEHDNYGGFCETFLNDDPDLSDNSIGATSISSAKVEQRASLPAAPTLLSPSNGTTINEGASINLSWSATGNEYYGEVWGGPGGTLTFGWQSGTSYNLGSQWAGYTYSWHVKARNSAGESGWSETRTFSVRLAAPTNLVGTATSCTQFTLTWNDNSSNEEGYKIYWYGYEIDQVGANVTSYQGIQDGGHSEVYSVKAYRGSSESDSSGEVVVITPSCVTPPSAPTLQSPSNGSIFDENQSLTLCWSATGNEYYGEIWGGPAGTLTFGWQGETCQTIGTQWAGYTYSWHVKARNSAGESGWSSTWTFTVRPNAPSGLVAQAVACDQINLSWTDNSGNEEGYKVYRNGVYIGGVGANVTSYWDTSIAENTSYSYYVKAFRGSIESAASNTAYVSTPVCPPPDTEPPVVTWALPVGNEQTYIVEDEMVQLQVEATDDVGVARVWFVRWDAVNSQWITIGNDYTAPYQTNLDCATLNYTWNQITALAYDAVGNVDEKYIWLYRLTPAPDLEPYTLSGYPYPVVPSSITGTHEVNPLYAGQPTYFDWHFANSGTAVATDTFHVELWVDATRYVRYPFSDFGARWVSGFDDWAEVVSTPGWHVVTLVTDPDDTINESDEDNNLWQEYFYWSPSAPFSDSMESGLNGWTATGLWHQVDDSSTYLPSHSPTHSWWYGQDDTGNYDTGAANSGDLTSPLIYIPTSGYFLRFNYAYATETQGPDWDQRWVQISVDGGSFNNVLQLYDDLMYRWSQSPAIDLSGYAGHAIQVRFHFDTFDDYYNAYLGWYIDDVDISTTPPPTCYDSYEPNNTYAQATALAYGDSPYADICPNGDYDFYRFTGTAGDKVVVDIDASIYGSALDSYIYLLDSDGSTVLTLSDDDYVSLDSHLGYELPHDGDYFIKVKAWNHPSVGSPNHFYVLNLLTDDTDPIAEMEAPLNGSYLSAITPITVTATDDHGVQRVEFLYHDGDWVNSEWQWLGADWDGSDGWSLDWDASVITDQSDIAIYIWAFDWVGHWNGAGSWNLTLDRTPPDTAVDISQPYGDAPFRDFWVSWWNSQDNLSGIASYDVQYRDGAGGVWTNLLLGTTEVYTRFVGTDDHTYYFRVRARDFAGNQSNYTLGDGDAQHTVAICDIAADAYEVDDNAANATELLFTNGYTQTHNIHSESNPDWIKFYAVAGFTYTLSTTDIGGHADTVLYLYDTDGSTLIDYNDDYWELGFSSRIAWQPSATGMYYASVIHWDPWAYGCTTAYGLSVASNDTTAPTGSIVINDGQIHTASPVITLTLNASDTGTGLAYVLLANNSDFNDGALLSYAPTLTWTLAGGDGNKTVYAQFYDWAGNPSVIYTDDIALDTTAPVGNVNINGGATYVTTTLVTLDLSASDANGVAAMRFSNNNTTYSDWVSYTLSYPWTLTGGNGVKTVYAEFRDIVGNVSAPATDIVTLDTVGPTGTINISGGAEYVNTPQVTVNLSATDANGVAQMRLSNDGATYSAWMAYATTASWTLTTGDGLKTVYVEFRDPAGNQSTAYNDTITLDTIAPTGTISINNGNEHTTSRTVTLNLEANDDNAGVTQMLVSNTSDFSGASWQAFASSLVWNLTTGAGTKTVYVKFRDRAGNESAVYSDAIIFYEPVTANFTANPTRGSAPLNVAFTDQSTGSVATWEWNFGDNATSTLQNPVHTYSIPGVYTVSLTVRLPGAAASLTGGTDTLVRTGYITIVDTYYIYLPLVVRNYSSALMSQENLSPDLGPLPRPY